MIILHGDNVVLSRKRLTDLIKDFQGERLRYPGEKLTSTELKQALESLSLFGLEKLVVIENLFSRRPSQEKENLLEYLKSEASKNLIIWEGKKIDGRTLAPFSQANVELFAFQPLIFRLLDSLAPENPKNSLNLFHQCLKQDEVEMVFYMLIRQSRLLIMAKDLGKEGLEKMADWQKGKLIRQSDNFTLEQLLRLHRQLLIIDWQQKTGRSSLPLVSQLDLLIASL